LRALEAQLGHVLPDTVREALEPEEMVEQASQTDAEVSLFDPRGPGGVQGEAAVDAPPSDVPVTTL
jgi:hypothetical protein